MKLLHIDSSPRRDQSMSRTLSAYLREILEPSQVTYRDLAGKAFPALAAEDLVALHGSTDDGSPELPRHRQLSDTLIDELKQADTLVLGVAMHNFSIPAVLKCWIDYVARAGHTFRYTENGPEGLTGIDTAYIVVATGGAPVGSDMDYASGYLRHICGFLGVETVHVIDASGSKRDPDAITSKGREQIDALLQQAITA